jgi:hypothetical protein
MSHHCSQPMSHHCSRNEPPLLPTHTYCTHLAGFYTDDMWLWVLSIIHIQRFTPMTEYSITKLEEYIRVVGNNFTTCLPLKIQLRRSGNIFYYKGGKFILDCQIFSFYASDEIFCHQKRKNPTDFGNPDGFFYSVQLAYSCATSADDCFPCPIISV